MAVLEKIRSKSALLFIVIIGALLAFILGDFLNSGCTRNNTTVAEVDGTEIDIQEFSNRLAVENSNNVEDHAAFRSQLLQQMIYEKLTQEEIEALGIVVSPEELQEAIKQQQNYCQYLVQMYQQVQDPQQRAYIEQELMRNQVVMNYEILKNPAQYKVSAEEVENLKQQLAQYEAELEQELARQKFIELYSGLITANVLDAQALHNEGGTTYNVSIVRQSLASLPDEEYSVSDDELKAEWENHKEFFRIEQPTRAIEIINVPVYPSDDDRKAAIAEYSEVLAALDTLSVGEALIGHNRFIANPTMTITKKQLEDARKSINSNDFVSMQQYTMIINALNLDTIKAGNSASLLSGINNYYSLLKVIDIRNEVDSANVSIAQVATKAEADSLLALLNSGKTFKDLTNASDSTDVLIATGGIKDLAHLKKMLTTAQLGQAFVCADTIGAQEVYTVARVNSRTAPVNVYDLAVVSYTLEPSKVTITTLRDSLNRYIKTYNTAEAFAANADSMGFAVHSAKINTGSPYLYFNTGNPNSPTSPIYKSYDAVKWAMTADKGSVSHIFTDDTESRLTAVAVTDIYEEDYLPWNDKDVKSYLTQIIRDNKKAAALIKKIGKAADLNAYAQAMNSTVQPMPVNFSSASGELAGMIAAAKPGTIIGPVKADGEVVVFMVNDVNDQKLPFEKNQLAQSSAQFNNFFTPQIVDMRSGSVNPAAIIEILRGKNPIEYNLLDFYNE